MVAGASMHSLWLMPDPDGLDALQAIQTDLADRFSAPRFDLHLTLLGGRPLEVAQAGAALAEIVRGIAPFESPILDVRISDAYFQSFYALFEASGPLLELKRRAMHLVAGAEVGNFMPHVSLLYGPVEAEAKVRAAERARAVLAGRPLRFTAVALARSSDTMPIADWRVERVAGLG